jgi:hypothetical protein
VNSAKIAPKAVKTRNIAPNAVGGKQLAADSVDGSKVLNGSLTPADLLGGASVVAVANGGPVNVTSSTPTAVPLSGGGWTQGPSENDLFVARLDATVASAPAGTCILTVLFEVGGTNVGTATAIASGSEPKTVTSELLLTGARVASGSPRPSVLSATATAFGIIEPCKSARIDSLKVVVLGVG